MSDKIGKAKGKSYAILDNVCFNMLFGYKMDRKKLIYKLDPYSQGTIYQLLSKSLLTGYKIIIKEPWKVMWIYSFQLIVSWGKLSISDDIVLWSNDMDERLTL